MEVGENLGQERVIESHTVGPEVQGIQNPVEALFPVERIGVAPGVSAGLAPQRHHNRTIDSGILAYEMLLKPNLVLRFQFQPRDH